MLVTLNRVLEYAEANNQAIGAFNACNYEGIQAIIRAAEELNQPVILQYADAHEGYITLDEIYSGINKLIKIENELFYEYIDELINEGMIVKYDDKYYYYNFYYAEKNIAKNLKPFINRKLNLRMLDLHFEEMINVIQEYCMDVQLFF